MWRCILKILLKIIVEFLIGLRNSYAAYSERLPIPFSLEPTIVNWRAASICITSGDVVPLGLLIFLLWCVYNVLVISKCNPLSSISDLDPDQSFRSLLFRIHSTAFNSRPVLTCLQKLTRISRKDEKNLLFPAVLKTRIRSDLHLFCWVCIIDWWLIKMHFKNHARWFM